jgi:hypothetical protein
VKCYHRTFAAAAILAEGFKDATGSYLVPGGSLTGVWFSDGPDGFPDRGDVLLSLEVPDDLFAEYEWVQGPPPGYREALIPAEFVNRCGPPRVEDVDPGVRPV